MYAWCIREQVREKITYELAKEWAILLHTGSTEILLVYPDGDLIKGWLDQNSWIVYEGKYVEHLTRVRLNNVSCNCDCCHEYHLRSEDPEERWTVEDYEEHLSDYVDETNEADELRNRMLDALDEIDYGYFEDERD